MKTLINRVNQKRIGWLLKIIALTWLMMTPLARANVLFLPSPPDQGAPAGRQRGGATRGDCLAYQTLTALVPEVDGVVWSQTASATPSFFFAIPADLTQAVSLEFVIQDSDDSYVFRKQFSMDAAAGILAIPMAPSQAELSPGKSYSWTFSIYCDPTRPSASVSVSGTIQRAVENSAALLPETPLELIRQHAAEGIWHEAIELAFNLYQSDTSNANYQQTLERLLEQAALNDIPLTALTTFVCSES
ncbi:MAG: DUF928 domain-containing protein [Leptolyngbya sp. SIO4C1]|nr:DUF928 domain-containing protein [Leptolyngbya sp. SIO4C1]